MNDRLLSMSRILFICLLFVCACCQATNNYDYFKDYLVDASDRAILILAANDVQKNLTLSGRIRFEVCLKKASTTNEYGRCVLAASSSGRKKKKIQKSRVRRRRVCKRNAEWSTVADNGTIGSDVANFLTGLVREIKGSLPAAQKQFDVIPPDLLSRNLESVLELNDQVQQGMNLLSPRVFSVMPAAKNRQNLLSPDLLSFYEGQNTIASLPTLLSTVTKSDTERDAWLRFIKEASGVDDVLRQLVQASEGALVVKNVDYVRVTDHGVSVVDAEVMQRLLDQSDAEQQQKLHERGFALLNEDQSELLNHHSEPQDPARLMMQLTEAISAKNQSKIHKRQTFAPPTILKPAIGGTIFVIYLLAPAILSPTLFYYIIFGPIVLSPLILSPFVLSPFIFAPTVLSPFILSPNVLSPGILSPVVLSPTILNPEVLSPAILSPLVLSPAILSPSVASPLILSPIVLNPTILSPAVLFASILSPGVLSPAILSPSDGPAILSPCFLCRKRKRRKRTVSSSYSLVLRFGQAG